MHLIFTGEDFNKSCVNLPQMRPIYWIWEVWRAICVWDGVWLRRDSLLTKEWGQSTRINRTGFPKVGVLIFSWELSPAIHFIPGAISIFLHFDGNKSSCFLFCFFWRKRRLCHEPSCHEPGWVFQSWNDRARPHLSKYSSLLPVSGGMVAAIPTFLLLVYT